MADLKKIKLPNNWAIAKLSDMVVDPKGDFVDGPFGSNLKANEYKEEGIPVFRIQNIKAGYFLDKNIQFVTPQKAEEIKRHSFKFGDIIITKLGEPLGLCCKVPAKYPYGIIVADLMRVRPSEIIVNTDYLIYAINSKVIQDQFKSITKGTTRARVNLTIVRDIEIPLAPLNEQKRIVEKLDELLSELEKGKEQLKTSLEQLKVYRQSILKDAFEGKLSEDWRVKQKNLKSPDQLVAEIKAFKKQQYERKLKEYKAGKTKAKPKEPEEIILPTKVELAHKPELPKGWIYVFLKDISDIVERVNLNHEKATETFLYLDIGGINNDKNIIENHKEYKWKDAPSRAQQIVKVNDILFSTVRTYMKNIAMVEDVKFSNQVASSGFTVVRALDGIISPKFLFRQLISDAFIQPLNEFQTGSSYPAVRDADVFNQIVPMCLLDEQIFVTQELDEKFSIVQNLEDTINQNLVQSESFRQTLLQKAFEGTLVEQDPNDEAASVLLERIKREREELLKVQKGKKGKEKSFFLKFEEMAEDLKQIIEILKDSKEPVSAKILWQSSIYKDDIDQFYAVLKQHIEAGEIIELPRKGKESSLKLADA